MPVVLKERIHVCVPTDTNIFILFHEEVVYHHRHLVAPSARIFLTLSHHPSLSFIASGRSAGLHPVSSQSCCM